MQLTKRPLRQSLAIRIALAGAWTLLALPAIELGYRLHVGRPVLTTENWRTGRIEDLAYGDGVWFDPHLGWAPAAHYVSDGYNTLAHGIRRNGSETEVRTGAMLAVGDAFTNGGFDVDDEETWPAHLERLLGTPVLNAGVDGYGADQIVMRAERLLPEVQPKALVVGLTGASIARAGLSFYSAPKPYYTIDKTGLAFNEPRPLSSEPASSGWNARLREILSYSALLDSVLSHVAPGYWLGEAVDAPPKRAENDPVAVTCALLKRLKTSAEAGTRVLVLIQHSHQSVAEQTEPGENASKVAACAGAEGLTVVDQFAALRAVAAKGTEALDRLYLNDGHDLDRDDDDGFGPMSEEGNRHTAGLLAQATLFQKSTSSVPYPGAGETGVTGSAAGGG